MTCRFFDNANIAGSGWCRHPKRVDLSELVLVRGNELACRNPWDQDLWQVGDRNLSDEYPVGVPPTDQSPGGRDVVLTLGPSAHVTAEPLIQARGRTPGWRSTGVTDAAELTALDSRAQPFVAGPSGLGDEGRDQSPGLPALAQRPFPGATSTDTVPGNGSSGGEAVPTLHGTGPLPERSVANSPTGPRHDTPDARPVESWNGPLARQRPTTTRQEPAPYQSRRLVDDGTAPLPSLSEVEPRARAKVNPPLYRVRDASVGSEPRRGEDERPFVHVDGLNGYLVEPRPKQFTPRDDALVPRDQDPIDRAPSLVGVPRCCGTCRDFRANADGATGVCVNAYAFSRQTMVQSDQLACAGGVGVWWLPVDDRCFALADTSHHNRPTPRVDQFDRGEG
jgi:hypothetical protein